MRVVAAIAIAVIALAGTAAGCGEDGGDAGAASPPSLDRAEYIERADEICQRLYQQRDPLEAEAARAAGARDTERAAEVFENAAEITDNRLGELRELPKPQGDERRLDRILGLAGEIPEAARGAASAVREGDERALARESRRGLRATARFDDASVGYGFLVCGRGAATEIG